MGPATGKLLQSGRGSSWSRPDRGDANYEEEIVPQLEHVSRMHLEETLHGREMQFFVGSFDPHHLGSRRLFVASQEGRVVAFIVCNPCVAGEMWAIEIYRKLPDAPRGVVPFAIMTILRQLKEEGIKYASLSLIPLLRCNTDAKDKMHHGSRVFYFTARFLVEPHELDFRHAGHLSFQESFSPRLSRNVPGRLSEGHDPPRCGRWQ